jgi:hypothetical protein
MKATELKQKLHTLIEEVSSMQQSAILRRIRMLLMSASVATDSIIKGEAILEKQGKEYFDTTPEIEKPIKVEVKPEPKKDNIKKPFKKLSDK